VGRFIAENLRRDASSKVLGLDFAERLLDDVGELGKAVVDAVLAPFRGSDDDQPDENHRILREKFTKLTGENNLFGSAGEFALLFALLAHKPSASEIDGEPAISLQDVRALFLEKRLPAGWRNWKKLRSDWVKHTVALARSAAAEYHALRP
jgi:hypothetical protein